MSVPIIWYNAPTRPKRTGVNGMRATIVCTKTHTHVETYPSQNKPEHCTCCSHAKFPEQIRPTSALDEFQLSYNVSPVLSKVITDQYARFNLDTALGLAAKKLTLNQFVENILSMPRASITPLNVHCGSCGSVFTMLRSSPDTYKTPPTYCVYCGADSVSVIQQDPEQIAFISLAEHYDVTVPMIQSLYKTWQSRPNYPTFQGFMRSDTVQQIKQIMEVTV